MTSFEAIVKKLEPVNIYSIEQGSNIYNELSAYCAALDEHRRNIDGVLRECFISSAEDYGIENREKVIGSPRTGYTTEERRRMLILRKAMGENDFTVGGFERFLSSIGVYRSIVEEMPATNGMAVSVNGSYSPADEAWICNQIRLMAPAHLSCSVYISGISWQSLDLKNLTFAQADSYNYSWIDFSSLE